MGSAWIFNGMATKMSFELGLHRKIKNDQVQNTEIKEMRDMAFWGCFVGEVYVFYCFSCHQLVNYILEDYRNVFCCLIIINPLLLNI